jgi:hypothetical protein
MHAKLHWVDGRAPAIELTLAGVIIGRGAECAVRTDDPMVSRRNTRIAFSGGSWCVEDLGSSNGTFVNEAPVQRQTIEHGDVVRCGAVRLRLQLHDADTLAPLLPVSTLIAREPKPMPMLTPLAPVDEELRVEASSLRARVADLERAAKQHAEEVRTLTDLGKELGDEVRELTVERARLKARVEDLTDELGAQDRQLERARQEVEQHQQRDEEFARFKRQQEELLNERRVGLATLEAAVQELRRERDEWLREKGLLLHTCEELRNELSAHQPAAYASTIQLQAANDRS